MAWLGTWAKRRKITVDNTNIDSDLSHFPVPIFIRDNSTEIGLVSHWKMNGDATDSYGTNDGTVNGATFTTGKINQAALFDGTDDYIFVNNSFANSEISGSMWIKTESTPTVSRSLIWESDEASGEGYFLRLHEGKVENRLRVWCPAGSLYVDDVTFNDNNWHHLFWVLADGEQKIYVDNVLKDSSGLSLTLSSTSTTWIATRRQADTTFYYGLIDDVRIYNRALSPAEVGRLYNAGSGTEEQFIYDTTDIFDEVGSSYQKIAVTKADGDTQIYVEKEQWDDTTEEAVLWVSKSDLTLNSSSTTDLYIYFDSAQANNTTYVGDIGSRTEVWNSDYKAVYHLTNATDSTSNNNDGTVSGATSGATGQIADAYSFDGTDDYINIPDSNDLSFGNGTSDSPFSISAWIYMHDATFFTIAEKANGSNAEWILMTQSTDTLTLICMDSTSSNRIYETSSVLTSHENTWLHVVATYDGSGSDTGIKLYVNASLDIVNGNGEIGTYNAMHNTATAVSIGRRLSFSTQYADGLIDEVQILSTNLSADWIKADYYATTDNLLTFSVTENIPDTGTNFQLNIGDSWKTVDALKINIGDSWKNVDSVQVNIGDSWKTVY